MARLFPFRSETSPQEGQPRVVDLEGEDADAVFSALSSTTARQIYSRLDEEPGTPSDVADAIDSSIQNVRYHLEKLEDAGLVEVVDTWYSSRGNEMSVYATTDGPLIVTSDESTASQLKAALSRFLGGVGALAGGSLFVQYGLTRWVGSPGTDAGATSDPGPTTAEDTVADDDRAAELDDEGGADEPADEPDDEAEEAADGSGDGDDGGFGTQDVDEDDEAPEEADDAADTATDDAATDDPSNYAAEDAGDETVLNVSGDLNGETAADGAEAAETVFATVPPGLLFFLGGLVVLLAVMVYWYWYRPAY